LSSTATANVTNGVLSITAQPQSATVAAGGSASFSVTATGNPTIRYQWRLGGTNIALATNSTYSIANAQPVNAGNYTVVCSNGYVVVTSSVAVLTVTGAAAPTILSQPSSITVGATSNATFSVSASGTVPLAYQWRLGGVNIAGATSASYTTNGVSLLASGNSYVAVITNLYGSITSAAAILTVTNNCESVVVTANPVSITRGVGGLASFSVTATGTAPLTYQWRQNGTSIGGATASSYVISPLAPGHAGYYSCAISNACSGAISAIATLSVTNTLAIPNAPQELKLAL
jgi:hypothetical protein